MGSNLTVIEVLKDKRLLGQFIKKSATWQSWFTFLRAFFALLPKDGDLELYKSCSGRSDWPLEPFSEAWLVIGTRGGKSFITALVATYLAVFREYHLSTGEKGYILLIAPSKKQSRIIKHYLSSFFRDNQFLAPFLVRETSEEIELSNNVIIATLASDYRTLRGYTAIAAIIDEIAFLNIEGHKPDIEIVRALRSRLLSTDGPLICISSPYARRGMLWETYKRHWGNIKSNILVWKADSRTMNPTLSEKKIKAAYDEDAAGASADYGAEFRADIESFITAEALGAVVIPGRFEIPPMEGCSYKGFVDPSGGSKDAMTLAIAHTEKNIRVLDCMRVVTPPFSPEAVTKDFADTLKRYKIYSVTGDKYGGFWPRERFQEHGINYETSDKPKSDIYKELLPLINSGKCELLDHDLLQRQLLNLERRTARSGKDSIDHPPNSHDDIANSAAGALVYLYDHSDMEIYTAPSLAAELNLEDDYLKIF